nr:hypothetical protein [Tanacetum cinerariifolium]
MHANGSGNSVRHDYCIMKEGMSTLRGHKSVPGISSNERKNGKKLVLKVILLCLTKRTMYHGRLVFSDDKLSDKELKQIKADDQAIQTILLGLPEDIYAAVDSCETA